MALGRMIRAMSRVTKGWGKTRRVSQYHRGQARYAARRATRSGVNPAYRSRQAGRSMRHSTAYGREVVGAYPRKTRAVVGLGAGYLGYRGIKSRHIGGAGYRPYIRGYASDHAIRY